MRMRPVAIISLILVVCVYLVLRADPTHEENTAMTGGETAIQKNNPSDSSSASNRVRAEPESEQADSSMTGIDASTAPANTDTTDVIIIGSYLNPDESPTFEQDQKETISIGIFVDADSYQDLPQNPDEPTISVGVLLEPDSSFYDQLAEPTETISLGQPINVNAFLAGQNTLSDGPNIIVGEQMEVPPEE